MQLRYNDARLEQAAPSDIRAYQLGKIQRLVEQAWRREPFYHDIWASRGGKRRSIDSLETFQNSIPIVRKADLIADQAAHPPYGKRLERVANIREPYLIFNTSGTSGQGVELHAMTMRERKRAFAVSSYCYRWAGLEKGDRMFLCYPVSMLGGGRIELYGLEDYGLTVFPVGSYDVHRKLELMAKFQPHAIMATTSYLGHLAAVGKEIGLQQPKVLFGGGEGASYSWFEAQEELWGAPFFNHYGATQTRVDIMYPCERGIGSRSHPGMLHNIEPGFYVEFIDENTGEHVRDGERGEIIVTSLIHDDFPLIRYAMGDAGVYRSWQYCTCGRPFTGMEIGTIGRLDDMKKIKGINVWPDAVDEAIFVHSGVDDYQVVLSRNDEQSDVASIKLMPKGGLSTEAVAELCERVNRSLRERVGIGFEVASVEPGRLPRSEYKARRWIDERESWTTKPTG